MLWFPHMGCILLMQASRSISRLKPVLIDSCMDFLIPCSQNSGTVLVLTMAVASAGSYRMEVTPEAAVAQVCSFVQLTGV